MSAARAVRGVLSGAERALFVVSGVAITLVSAVLVLQVFMRYVLNSPTVWSEEFATLAFVWCVMTAIPVAVRRSEHIAVTLLLDRLRGKVRRAFVALGYALSAGLFGLVAVYAAMMLPTGAPAHDRPDHRDGHGHHAARHVRRRADRHGLLLRLRGREARRGAARRLRHPDDAVEANIAEAEQLVAPTSQDKDV